MSHSLNESAYPAGHAATKGRPVPNPLHIASIENEANVKAAINFVMLNQSLSYEDAAALVHEKGEKYFLEQRDRAPQPKPELQTSPLKPGEEVINLDATPVKPKIVATGGKK
jgi:hypothetical protein